MIYCGSCESYFTQITAAFLASTHADSFGFICWDFCTKTVEVNRISLWCLKHLFRCSISFIVITKDFMGLSEFFHKFHCSFFVDTEDHLSVTTTSDGCKNRFCLWPQNSLGCLLTLLFVPGDCFLQLEQKKQWSGRLHTQIWKNNWGNIKLFFMMWSCS